MKANISLLHWVGRPRTFIVRYGIALLAVAVALSTRFALDHIVPEAVPFAFDFVAILIATAAGGIGPGILATILSGFATWLLFVTRTLPLAIDHTPRLSEIPWSSEIIAFAQNPVFLSRGALTNLAIFLITSLLMIMGAAALRNAIIRRRNSERELQESERRFRAVTDTMPQLVWSTLPDGTYDYYNQRCIEFAGEPPDADGGAWKKLLHPDDRVRTRETWARSLKTGRTYEIEYRFRGADDEYHWFLGRAVPVRNGEGGIERWFGSSTDISDIVSARETLARGKDQQERLVTERTVELAEANDRLRAEIQERSRAEEKLRQAHKMEALGQLTGGVAHDFNNLLTVVIGNIEAIGRHLSGEGTAAVRNYADSAMQGARRAAVLTQRLLAFARGQPLEPKPTDINSLLSGMSELLVRTLGERISMQTIFANGLWPTEVDPNHFESVLLNLAANARDAMPEGGTLTIETSNTSLDRQYASAHSEVTPGNYVLVSVRDTGTGMSKETLAHVFEPFFTTKPVGQGTGLGLSQLYGFMKQSGGHVHIESALGKGTTVALYLPRFVDEQAEFVAKQKQLAPETQKQETVLTVEDDEDVRRYAVGMLRELGYNVLEAGDGEAALRLLESHPEIRFLFSDVGLPGGYNGRQLADEALRRRPYLKVLFTTGYGLDGIIHDGRLDPDVQLITKPFTFDDFAEKVRKVFDMSSKGKILLVEDEALVAMVAAESLRDMGFDVEEVASVAAALKCANNGAQEFAAAIIDIGLPDGKGDALARELKNIRPDFPIVIATGQGDGALDVHLKKAPQLTLLSKPYDSEDLRKSLAKIGLS